MKWLPPSKNFEENVWACYPLKTHVLECFFSILFNGCSVLGIDSSAPLIQWFWEVMEEFTNQERSLFLRFVWGRTRLPRTIADFRGRDFVIQILDKYNPPDHFLPESYTCFFLLKMPRYSCKVSILILNKIFKISFIDFRSSVILNDSLINLNLK